MMEAFIIGFILSLTIHRVIALRNAVNRISDTYEVALKALQSRNDDDKPKRKNDDELIYMEFTDHE